MAKRAQSYLINILSSGELLEFHTTSNITFVELLSRRCRQKKWWLGRAITRTKSTILAVRVCVRSLPTQSITRALSVISVRHTIITITRSRWWRWMRLQECTSDVRSSIVGWSAMLSPYMEWMYRVEIVPTIMRLFHCRRRRCHRLRFCALSTLMHAPNWTLLLFLAQRDRVCFPFQRLLSHLFPVGATSANKSDGIMPKEGRPGNTKRKYYIIFIG